MMTRVRCTLAACLYTLESNLLDVQIWLLRHIAGLTARQIDLLEAAAAYVGRSNEL